MKAKDIKKILTEYYSGLKTKYKCFEEVKTGNTWSDATSWFIIDFLAYKIGWRKSELLGFEIKVSRSDFKSDKKWPNYIRYVNKLSFACPENLIKKEELSDGIGLVYILESGKMKWIRRPKVVNEKPNYTIFQYIVNSKL